MSNGANNIQGNNIAGTGKVTMVNFGSATTASDDTNVRAAAGTSFGAAVQSANARRESSVKAIAARYDNFEDALLPMVLASGVSGDAAVATAQAIMSNPALKAQAERAYSRARISAVN